MDNAIGEVAWRILFNEDVEKLPDPNKPENQAYISAKIKQRREKLERFARGDGEVLFKIWQDRIRMIMKDILMSDNLTPDCPVCSKILNVRVMANTIAEVQFIIDDNK